MIKVPAFRVVPCDRNETIFGMEKIRSLRDHVNEADSQFQLKRRSTRFVSERTSKVTPASPSRSLALGDAALRDL